MDDIVFDHTGFITPSLEGSVRFWSEVMGFEPKPSVERRGDWVAPFTGVPGAGLKIAHLFGRGTHLEFIEFAAGGGSSGEPVAANCGTGHVCFKVRDIEATVQRVLDGGGRLAGRITTITEGAATGVRGLYLRDPYGVLIELLELK